MAACYYCNGTARCDGCGGRGVQFDGGGSGKCQHCTDGQMSARLPEATMHRSYAPKRPVAVHLLTVLLVGLNASAAWGQTVTPTVDYPGILGGPPTLTQERGLNLSVPPVIDVAAVNVQEAALLLARRNAGFRPGAACGTTLPWVLNGTSVVAAPGVNLGSFFGVGSGCFNRTVGTLIETAFAERRVENILVSNLIDNSIGSPGTVTVRGLGIGLPVLTVNAADLAGARRSLAQLAQAQSHGRFFVGSEVRTGGGPTVSSDRTLGQNLTGRDTLFFLFGVIGGSSVAGGPLVQVITSTQTNCPTANSTIGCQGGVRVDVQPNISITTIHTITTLFITTSVERTISGGTTFYDAALTPLPIGAVHAAAQSAGFDAADRFLGRLGRADLGVSDDRRAHIWGEAWVGRTRFDAHGEAGRTSADGHGFLLGAAFAVSDSLTLGLAGEWGRSTLDVANALTPESARADHLSGGVHARLRQGRFSANAAAMIGTVDVDSAGASSLGTATGRYDATIKGASADAGYDIGAGAVTLRPHIGFTLLDWRRGAFAEVGGPAPLSVARASGQQSRLWAGLSARGSAGALTLAAYARAARVGGDRVAAVTTFDPQLPGVPFVVTGPDHGRTLGEYGAEASIALGPNARAALGYDGRSSGGLTTHAGRVTVRMGF